MFRLRKWVNFRSQVWRRHGPSIAIWLSAVAAIVFLLERRSGSFETVGIAQVENRQIAPAVIGRVRIMPTRLFDIVRQGQTLAVLEDDRVRSELATAAAEIARLRAELFATQDRLAFENKNITLTREVESRRFQTDVESIRLQILDMTTILETDRLNLKDNQLQVEFLEGVFKQNAATRYEYDRAKIAFAALEKKIRETEKALAQAKIDHETSLQRRKSFETRNPGITSINTALAPLREAITVQERRMAELGVDQAMLVLKSPIDGTVSQVLRGAGEAVRAGEPILVVSAARPSSIIAYLNEIQMKNAREGMTVELIRQNVHFSLGKSKVLCIGPTIEQLPNRLWRNPAIPEWGRALMIDLPANVTLVPGELVQIRSN